MNRSDLQQLAKLRIKEAKVLLDNGCYEGSYYLAGYAVECALKACIAKQTKRYDFPPDRETIQSIYIHDLTRLLQPAGLKAAFDSEIQTNAAFQGNWSIVKDWSEQRRYEPLIARAVAADLYAAIVSRRDGVLPWLKKRW